MACSAACSAAACCGASVMASRTGAVAGALPVSVAPWTDVAKVAVCAQPEVATEAEAEDAAAVPSVTSTPSVLVTARPRRTARDWDMGSPGRWAGCRGVGALTADVCQYLGGPVAKALRSRYAVCYCLVVGLAGVIGGQDPSLASATACPADIPRPAWCAAANASA